MTDINKTLLSALEQEKAEIEAEMERQDNRRVELISRKMEIKRAIKEITKWGGLDD